MAQQNGFADKKCLVTGAGRGIGRAIVAELYCQGATVYALSKNPEHLKTLKEEFPKVIPICVDLSNWEEASKAVESIEPVDCLINNAGIAQRAAFLETSPQNVDAHFDVNYKATVIISQIVARKMIKRGKGGSIVNMSSIASQRALPNCGIYCCTKAALDMLTKVMALELGPHQIRVNSVNPGSVLTDMNSVTTCDASTKEKIEKVEKILISRTPTQTLWMPIRDVVNTTLFLASNQTSQITGQCIAIDGGYLAN
ncbi:L-xylulose reductase [Orchesella cincta]|uniref:L-xylulose reductase n=1 Tax=Orchesella cincta TaxID=48709 RepID=A0A1D2MLG2_ORCCI|nr:L-xylulose reductase [Orchesella cincta]